MEMQKFNKIVDHIYAQHAHRLNDWNQPLLAPAEIQLYADAIHEKGAPLETCFGFVDGAARRQVTIYTNIDDYTEL